MNRRQLLASLSGLDLPNQISGQIPGLPRNVDGILVYGSRARGDSVEGSDLDLLALVPMARPTMSRSDVSVSFYTEAQLRTGIGTLFGAHLKRDARVLWDPSGRLRELVDGMGGVDTRRLKSRASMMSSLFTTPNADLPRYLEGMLRQARFLLRSSLYAQAIEEGDPCFSVRELARRLHDPQLTQLLASRRQSGATYDELNDCLWRLRTLIGEFPGSKHGSLEATVVNEWGTPSDLLSASFLILGSTGIGSVYSEVEKILL